MKAKTILPLRGRIPMVSSAQLLATNPLHAKKWRITLHSAETLSLHHASSMPVVEWMQLSSQRLRFLFAPERDSTLRAVEERAWFDFSGQSRLLAFALAFEERIAQLSGFFGEALMPTLVIAHSQLGKLANGMVFLRYRIEAASETSLQPAIQAQGFIGCMPNTLAQLLEAAQSLACAPTTRMLEAVQHLPISLQLKPLTLSVAEYTSLRSGDVLGLGPRAIALNDAVISAGGAGSISAYRCKAQNDGWCAVAKANAAEFIELFEDAMSIEESKDAPESQAAPASPAPNLSTYVPPTPAASAADIAHLGLSHQLEIQIGFELARSQIAISELAQLQPGYVFKLNAPLEGQNVRILSNGKVLGHGELVSVGDFLGVRLLELG